MAPKLQTTFADFENWIWYTQEAYCILFHIQKDIYISFPTLIYWYYCTTRVIKLVTHKHLI